MQIVEFACFVRLHSEDVELLGQRGETVFLDRSDIDDPKVLDFLDDDKVLEYFRRNSELVVTWEDAVTSGAPIRATRRPLFEDCLLAQVRELRRGEPLKVVVRDTNSQLYAYCEITPDVEGRIDKRQIRRFLKERAILPPLSREELSTVDVAMLAGSLLGDDNFWRAHYREYELCPGDTVIGCVAGFDSDPQEGYLCVDLDLTAYLDQLGRDPADIIARLGFVAGGIESAQAIQSPPRESHELLAPPPAEAQSILMLDDHERDVLEPASSFLRKVGFDVEACASVRQAQAAVDARLGSSDGTVFGTAIIDIHLSPSPSAEQYAGILFARWLQERMPRCAIILLSAEQRDSADGNKTEAAGDLRIVDYIIKPVRARELRHLLRLAPSREKKPARAFFESLRQETQHTQQRLIEVRETARETLQDTLDQLRTELSVDSVFVFRMHRVSREVSIAGHVGQELPRFNAYRRTLRYSPVRDVCEEGESFCHTDVPSRFYNKHRKLLETCLPSERYSGCAACRIPSLDADDLWGDEYWCCLFAFAFPSPSDGSQAGGFRVAAELLAFLPEGKRNHLREEIVLCLMREYAARVAQHLMVSRFEEVEVRQSPMLMLGMADSSMGHDLANCLMGADQALASLTVSLTPGSVVSDEDIRMLQTLEVLAGSVAGIARTFSKQARAHEERATSFDVTAVIEAACLGVRAAAEHSKTEIFFHREPQVSLSCPRGALERVLFNLLLNAVQQVGLSLRGWGFVQVNHFLTKTKKGRQLVIQVYDSGTGIHGFRKNSIFDPGVSTTPDGSGMGLTICREILKGMDATVRIRDSVLFCGTCFEIALPAKLIAS